SGSLLAQWQSATDRDEKNRLANALQDLLTSWPQTNISKSDVALYQQLASLGGPLLRRNSGQAARSAAEAKPASVTPPSLVSPAQQNDWGLDPASFGTCLNGPESDSASLCGASPSMIEVRLPADLTPGTELVTTGRLHPALGEGCVQL